MNLRTIIPIIALAAAAAGPLHAQATENLLSTVGTVVEKDGRHYAYILWQPDKGAATFGKRFAIYRKDGDIPSTSPYTRLGVQTLQTSPETIRAMLNLGDKVDFGPGAAAPQIAKVYQSITLRLHPGTPPADPNLDASGKLAYMIAAATEHNEVLDQLFMLGRAHPGVMLALGHAFMIEVPATGVKTYELREIDAADHDVQVLGRVELDPANPPVPPAPGPPVAVPHPVRMGQYLFSQKDDLNARLRWGVPDMLRHMLPYTFGFDVFRVKKSDAVSLGWNSTPPTRGELMQALALPDPPVVRSNDLPVLPDKLLTLPEAANASDRETFFFADDNGIAKGRNPFHDGDEFYFFVAARTITGHPGDVSPGALVQMCDRMPPRAPRIVMVQNVFTKPADPADWADQGGSQHLKIKILQLPEDDPGEAASEYYIYRWKSAKQYLMEGGDPDHNKVGSVAHAAGQRFVYFDDAGAGAPRTADAGKTFWYTVRAVDRAACATKNLSAHSAPKYGVIRDRTGPGAPTGEITICRFVPNAEYQNKKYDDPGEYGSDGMRREFRVDVVRTSMHIAAFEIRLESYKNRDAYSHLTIPFRQGELRGITFPYDETKNFTIYVRGISATGVRGNWAQVQTSGEGGGRPPYQMPVYHFQISLDRICDVSSTFPDDPPRHSRIDPDGRIIPIHGTILFGVGVREWRIYRRVGCDGPLSLIAKGQGKNLPNPAHWQDAHMPSKPGTLICYYGQVFDENDNPSPLQRLEAILVENPDLPVPLLEEPKLKDDLGNGRGRIQLTWFCDPVGVDRFEILVASDDGNPADPVADSISQRLSDAALSDITDTPEGLLFYPYQTQRLDGAMGSGPEFSLILEVPIGKTLYFAVRATGRGDYEHRPTGGFSNVVAGVWSEPPPEPSGLIPWPARPLPDSYEITRNVASYGEGEGPYYAMCFQEPTLPAANGILIGLFHGLSEFQPGIGLATQLFSEDPSLKPEDYVFDLRTRNRDAGGGLEDLMPFMLYRYQLPSEAYPEAAPNIVQCTPLIDRFSWKDLGWDSKYNREIYELRDPYLALFPSYDNRIQVPSDGTFSREPSVTLANVLNMPSGTKPPYAGDFNAYMFVVDRLPVVKGCKYQYIIVSFDKRGEIRRVIPVNPVQN